MLNVLLHDFVEMVTRTNRRLFSVFMINNHRSLTFKYVFYSQKSFKIYLRNNHYLRYIFHELFVSIHFWFDITIGALRIRFGCIDLYIWIFELSVCVNIFFIVIYLMFAEFISYIHSRLCHATTQISAKAKIIEK